MLVGFESFSSGIVRGESDSVVRLIGKRARKCAKNEADERLVSRYFHENADDYRGIPRNWRVVSQLAEPRGNDYSTIGATELEQRVSGRQFKVSAEMKISTVSSELDSKFGRANTVTEHCAEKCTTSRAIVEKFKPF